MFIHVVLSMIFVNNIYSLYMMNLLTFFKFRQKTNSNKIWNAICIETNGFLACFIKFYKIQKTLKKNKKKKKKISSNEYSFLYLVIQLCFSLYLFFITFYSNKIYIYLLYFVLEYWKHLHLIKTINLFICLFTNID